MNNICIFKIRIGLFIFPLFIKKIIYSSPFWEELLLFKYWWLCKTSLNYIVRSCVTSTYKKKELCNKFCRVVACNLCVWLYLSLMYSSCILGWLFFDSLIKFSLSKKQKKVFCRVVFVTLKNTLISVLILFCLITPLIPISIFSYY